MTTLGKQDIGALRKAFNDTHKALATYDQIILEFGPLPPFPGLRDVEARHIRALEALFVRYGLPLPRPRRRVAVRHFPTLAQAFAACIATETSNVKMLQRLRSRASRSDILAEITNLRRASRDGHLPALQAGASELLGRGWVAHVAQS